MNDNRKRPGQFNSFSEEHPQYMVVALQHWKAQTTATRHSTGQESHLRLQWWKMMPKRLSVQSLNSMSFLEEAMELILWVFTCTNLVWSCILDFNHAQIDAAWVILSQFECTIRYSHFWLTVVSSMLFSITPCLLHCVATETVSAHCESWLSRLLH